jgi:hypothetical protein
MACADALKFYADHMASVEAGKIHTLRFVLVTGWLGATSHYAEGTLSAWNAPIASGSGFKYSSYERWNFPAPVQLDPKAYPFDPNRRDAITLSVNLTTGQVAGSFAFQAKCENGILYGFSNPTGFLQFHVMHVLALLTSSEPIIA